MRRLRKAIVAVLCMGAVAPCAGFSASLLPVMSRRFIPRTASLACARGTSAPNSREALAHTLHCRMGDYPPSRRPCAPSAHLPLFFFLPVPLPLSRARRSLSPRFRPLSSCIPVIPTPPSPARSLACRADIFAAAACQHLRLGSA
jgi:hypothetical protein